MPYDGEFASYGPLRRIASNASVKALVQRCEVAPPANDALNVPQPANVTPSGWEPEFIYAVDGSHHEVPVRNGFPSAEVSYVTCASVLLHARLLRELDAQRPIDPVQFNSTRRPSAVDAALPGCNVVMRGEADAASSFRRALFESLAATRLAEDGETLLDTYEQLRTLKPDATQKSPYGDCVPGTLYASGRGEYICKCGCGRPLYSTDALRIHEGMNPNASNGAMFAEVMQVFGHLVLVNTLRYLESKKLLATLQRVAFVMDGPLAVFGHPAWLSKSIKSELQRINRVAASNFQTDVLLIGVEKHGAFVEHFDLIDQMPKIDPAAGDGRFPPQSALLLDNDYIRSRIIVETQPALPQGMRPKPYGADTYYGRKFFYKTRSGARIVATLPLLARAHEDIATAAPSQFPRLADAMSLLDQVVSSRFSHAVSPLIMAHSEAAIPLNLGAQVLQTLAKRLMGMTP